MIFFFQKKSMRTAVVLILALAIVGCGALGDVDFARTLMTRLTKGLYLARPMIDWSSFKALEEDVGALYRGIPDEQGRVTLERMFIDNFKKGFQQTKANMRMFSGWRSVRTLDPAVGAVIVDMPASRISLLLVLHKAGGKSLLREIKAVQMGDAATWEKHAQEYGLDLSTEKKNV